jgi:hypothetical protein
MERIVQRRLLMAVATDRFYGHRLLLAAVAAAVALIASDTFDAFSE